MLICDPPMWLGIGHIEQFKDDRRTMSMSSEDITMLYWPFLPYITSHSVTLYNIAVTVNIPAAVMFLVCNRCRYPGISSHTLPIRNDMCI